MNNQNKKTNNENKPAGSLSSSDRRSNNTPQGGVAQSSSWEERSEGSVPGNNSPSQARTPNASRRRKRRGRRELHHAKWVLQSFSKAPLDTLTVRNKKKLAWALRQATKSPVKIGNKDAVQHSVKNSPTEAERSSRDGGSVPTEQSTPESNRPADLTFAVIDRGEPDGRISFENWAKVEFGLMTNYLNFVDRHKGPAPTGFDEGWHQGRVKLMSFKDKRSATLYKTAIGQLGEVWKGAQLDVVRISEIPCRPSARTRLPLNPSDRDAIYTIIRRCNPDLPTENWTIAELGEPEGKYRSAVITINNESLKPLAELKGKIHYGFGTINLIVCKKDEKVSENQISSSSTSSSVTPAKKDEEVSEKQISPPSTSPSVTPASKDGEVSKKRISPPSTSPSVTPTNSVLPIVSVEDKDERVIFGSPSPSTSSSSTKGRWLPFQTKTTPLPKKSCETRRSNDEAAVQSGCQGRTKDKLDSKRSADLVDKDEAAVKRGCQGRTKDKLDSTRSADLVDKDEAAVKRGRRGRPRDRLDSTRSADYKPYGTNRAAPERRFSRSSYDRMLDNLNIESEYTSLALSPYEAALAYRSRSSELYPYEYSLHRNLWQGRSSPGANRMDMSEYSSNPWHRYM